MYYVRLFVNTGYDLVNIPYDPASLADESYYDVPAIDFNDFQYLSEVRVKFSVATPTVSDPDRVNSRVISDIDYVAISPNADFNMDRLNPSYATFYSVIHIEQEGVDVLKLSLAKDYITSSGGLKNLTFLNGVITRLSVQDNVPANIDDFSEDDMLGVIRPLQVEYSTVAGDGAAKTTLVESTVDLDGSIGYESITDGTITDLIARMDGAGTTTYQMGSIQLSNVSGSQCYFVGNAVVMRGLTNARSLGIESAILSQFVLPGAMHDPDADIVISEQPNAAGAIQTITARNFDDIDSGFRFFPTNIDFTHTYYHIFFGEKCKVGMIGASGEKAEFRPEDIIFTPQGTIPADNTIRIKKRIDPRPQGRPYFRFKYIHGDKTVGTIFDGIKDFMMCVKGAEWKKVPLRFTTVSGAAVASMNFKNSMGIKNLQWEAGDISRTYAREQLRNTYNITTDPFYLSAQVASGGVPSVGAFPQGEWNPNLQMHMGASNAQIAQYGLQAGLTAIQAGAASMTTGMNQILNQVNLSSQMTAAAEDQKYYNRIQLAEIEAEKARFGVTSQLTVPTVMFTDDVDIFRDVTKNGCVVYRYLPSPQDIERLTKIIKMFGAKRNILFKGNGVDIVGDKVSGGINRINGRYFTYLQMQGAEISEAGVWLDANNNVRSSIPKYEREGIAAQLSAGVRIWKNATPRNYENNYTDYLNL